jgi:hypothetical protein
MVELPCARQQKLGLLSKRSMTCGSLSAIRVGAALPSLMLAKRRRRWGTKPAAQLHVGRNITRIYTSAFSPCPTHFKNGVDQPGLTRSEIRHQPQLFDR